MKGFLLFVLLGSNLFFQSQAQILNYKWTVPFYSEGSSSFVTGMSITSIDYVYSVHCFEGYSSAGYFPNSIVSEGDEDILIVKTSKTRNTIWHRQIGGEGQDRPTAIEQLSNGDIIISGIFSDSVDFDPGQDTVWKVSQGQMDNFVLKLDKDGNYINCVTFGGSGMSYVSDLQITQYDEIFICGWYTDSLNFKPLPQLDIHVSAGDYSSYLSKFDSNLNYISSIAFEGDNSIYDLFITKDQTILFTGTFNDTIYTYFNDSIDEKHSAGLRDVIYGELDDQLNIVSQRTIGSESDEIGMYIGQLKNGSVVLQFNFSDPFVIENGSEPVFVEGLYANLATGSAIILKNTMLLCINDNAVLWHKIFSATGPYGRVHPYSEFVPDENGSLIANYTYRGICNLGENNFNLIQSTALGVSFFLKIDQTGNIHWVRSLDSWSSGGVEINIMKLKGDDFYAGGRFWGTVDFDLSVGTSQYWGSSEPFITKWSFNDTYLSLNENVEKPEGNLFPNPANENLYLNETDITDLRIYELSGREIHADYQFLGANFQINTELLRNGAYILQYEKEGSIFSKRFVVHH